MAVNLRAKPIDRRRLSEQDKSDYNMARSKKIAGARARRGQMAQQQNAEIAHTSQTPGTGGFTAKYAQSERNKEEGAKVARSKALRPTTDDSMYDIYQD